MSARENIAGLAYQAGRLVKRLAECGEAEKAVAAEELAILRDELRVAREGAVVIREFGGHLRATSGKGWHVIRAAKDGSRYCTCAAWKFQRIPAAARSCKHLAKAKQLGLI